MNKFFKKSISIVILLITIQSLLGIGVTSQLDNSSNNNTKNNVILENNNSQTVNSKVQNGIVTVDQGIQQESSSSIDSTNQLNNFNKQGQGNNTLLRVNESFSIQTSSDYSNSIAPNTSTTLRSISLPSYTNYNLIDGSFNINNVNSSLGANTIEWYSKPNQLSYPSYKAVASSFTVTQDKINISSISYYLNETGITNGGPRSYSTSIRGISSGIPNGTIYFQTTGSIGNNFGVQSQTMTLSTNNTFSKGTYAFVISYSGTLPFYFPYVPDNVSGNKSLMWTNTSNWNTYPGDLPFYYNFIILNSNDLSQTFSYSNPSTVNLKINNQPLTNYLTNFAISSPNSFNVTSNLSISYRINFFLYFKRINLLSVSSMYNITNGVNFWNENFTISSFTTSSTALVIRNFTLMNIPTDWSYNNQVFNSSSLFTSYKTYPLSNSTMFLFQIQNSASQGNFKLIFSDENYATSISILDSNNSSISNLTISALNTNLRFASGMSIPPTLLSNISLILENSTNSQIAMFNSLNASILGNSYIFSLFNLTDFFYLNSSYQGMYKLLFSWFNSNLTQVGYYEQPFLIVVATKLNLVSKSGLSNPSNNTVSMSSQINLVYNFTNLFTSSSISNTSIQIDFSNEYGQNNNDLVGISSNSTTDRITVSIITDPALTPFYRIGYFNFIIVISKFGFQPQTKAFSFFITGFKVKIDLSYNNKIVRGQDFNVKAVVSSASVSSQTNLFKKVSTTSGPDLNNLNISINFSVTFLNNTRAIITNSSTTDQNGNAFIELSSSNTKEIKSIDSIQAQFSGNDQILGQSTTISNPGIQFVENTSTSLEPLTFGMVFLIVLIAGLLVILFLGFAYLYNSSIKKSKVENLKFNDHINALEDFLGMYLTTKQGLPVFLKSNQQSEDQNQHLMLSGVTYSIDLFLSNFKDEYTRTISKDSILERSDNIGFINMTVIDQQNFKIIIGVSDSYRMYVLIKNSNQSIIKLFQNVLDNIEKSIKITRTIINLQQIYPLFVHEIEKEFPIELVNEFEIRFDKLIDLITDSTQTFVSSSTINKLKEFSFYLAKNSNLDSSIAITDEFDFKTLVNNSKKIKIQTFTLSALINILLSIKCSRKNMYEILYICSGSKISIFQNITPISIPENPQSPSDNTEE